MGGVAVTAVEATTGESSTVNEARPADVRASASTLTGSVLRVVSRWWAVAAIVLAWHVWVTINDYNSIVMPTPGAVALNLVSDPGPFIVPTLRTLLLATGGVIGGVALGYGLALASWASTLLSGAINPLVVMLRSIPIVAMIPVVARLIGYGSKVVPVVTIMMAFFPTYVLTTSGLRSASKSQVDILRSLGAGRFELLRRVLVPSSIPNVLVALRLSASSAVLIAMVGEFLAGNSGLGRLFADARNRLDAERAWGAAVVATVLSVVCFNLAVRAEQWGRRRFR